MAGFLSCAASASRLQQTAVYNFCTPDGTTFCTDGAAPNSTLIEDASGNLYGTTVLGGTGTHALECMGLGCGTVFKLSPNSGGYAQTVLYSFCSQGGSNCTDGGYPYGDGCLLEGFRNPLRSRHPLVASIVVILPVAARCSSWRQTVMAATRRACCTALTTPTALVPMRD